MASLPWALVVAAGLFSAGAAASGSTPAPPGPAAIDPKTIHTVLVMQSCHLDVGFADFSTNIINRFFHQREFTSSPSIACD